MDNLNWLRIDQPKKFFQYLKPDLEEPSCPLESFFVHFQTLFYGEGRPEIGLGEMQWSQEPFKVGSGSII